MHFFTIASLLAATVSGAACGAKKSDEPAAPTFDVENFKAFCLPHGGACYYVFEVYKHRSGEDIPTECNTSVRGDGSLPSINDGQCNSSRTFDVIRNEDGSLNFSVTQQVTPISFTTSNHTIPADQIEVQDGQEVYVGPTSFGLYGY
ncbi:hypothetical protein BDW02DRAFT_629458 [Decorospora gaudefroyi]|uniref:Hypersensitive response-inducing protein n=1 Tax=Decorospora gaudefroyi TaxID=184978 RepID=A0A6A5KEK8_9PLEO|nr:hypothetical protein BDW02DRAFT_629458 [Decorospora gaudefroyi]